MKNVLFLCDKFCGGNPSNLSSHHWHFLGTFQKEQPDYILHYLFYDEYAYLSGYHIDRVLVPYCVQNKIDLVFICFRGQDEVNPSAEAIKELKEHNIKTVVFWPDTNKCDQQLQKKLSGLINLNISLDNPRTLDGSLFGNSNFLRLWTPQPDTLFYSGQEQDIEVSFIGSLRYPERQNYINNLKVKIPDFFTTAGQRESGFSIEKYASYIRRSKIGVNFCNHPEKYSQLKGRVFEIIASQKSLLLEEKNLSTRDFFTPGVDYVEFENLVDLTEKIEYYRNNDSERLKIAENGYNKFKNNWTAAKFWQRVMENLK